MEKFTATNHFTLESAMFRSCCWTIIILAVGSVAIASDDAVETRAPQVQSSLSGAWNGKAKVVAYLPTNLPALPLPIKIPKSPVSGNALLQAEFFQNGFQLSMQVTLTTMSSRRGVTGQTFFGVLDGVIGNDSFYVIGVTTNANASLKLALTGHVSANGIAGIGIAYGGSDNEIVYSLKPATPAGARSLETPGGESAGSPIINTSGNANGPISVSGAAAGKAYALFESTTKPAPFQATVLGAISAGSLFGLRAATLSLNGSNGSDTFVLTGSDLGNNLGLSGPNSVATKTLIVSIHLNGKGAKGIGILVSPSLLAEFKLSAKRQ